MIAVVSYDTRASRCVARDGDMTRWEKMDERARRIVRGTMEPLSGWYDSPVDLEREIIEAMHWAYWMGVETLRAAIAPFACCAAERAAGASYRVLPDKLWQQALDAYLDVGGKLDEDAQRRIARANHPRTPPDHICYGSGSGSGSGE